MGDDHVLEVSPSISGIKFTLLSSPPSVDTEVSFENISRASPAAPFDCTYCKRITNYWLLVLTFVAVVICSAHSLTRNSNDNYDATHHPISLQAVWKSNLEEAVAAALTRDRNSSAATSIVYNTPPPTAKRLFRWFCHCSLHKDLTSKSFWS